MLLRSFWWSEFRRGVAFFAYSAQLTLNHKFEKRSSFWSYLIIELRDKSKQGSRIDVRVVVERKEKKKEKNYEGEKRKNTFTGKDW